MKNPMHARIKSALEPIITVCRDLFRARAQAQRSLVARDKNRIPPGLFMLRWKFLRTSALAGAAALWFCTSGAQPISSNAPSRFIPGLYSSYLKWTMNAQELQAFHKAGSNYVDKLLTELPLKPINAYTLHQIGDNGIKFSKEQIDLLVANLVRSPWPAESDKLVAEEQIRETLCNIFGIRFFVDGEGNGGGNHPEEFRRPYNETWQKFWLQNRGRYGSELPLVINDLSLAAKLLTNGVDEGVEITIHNHGTKDTKFFTEAPGRIRPSDAQNPNLDGLDYHWPGFTIYADGAEVRPEIPAAYYRFFEGPQDFSMPSPDSGRAAHLELITIPQGQSYVYTMKFKEAFPQLTNRAYTNLVVRYQYHLYGIHKDDSVWRGELHSLPIIKNVSPSP